MQERALVASEDSVRALNLIDIVFRDSMQVREAWAELYNAFANGEVTEHERQARLRALLREIAIDLGIQDTLRIDDFGRIYFPNALAEAEKVRQLETKAALERLTKPASAQKSSGFSPFPPKPKG